MSSFFSGLLAILALLLSLWLLVFPFVLTVWNVANTVRHTPSRRRFVDTSVFVLGPLLTAILYGLISWEPWYEPGLVDSGFLEGLHEPLSSEHVGGIMAIVTLACVAVAGYVTLRVKGTALPPLLVIACIGAMHVGVVLSVVWILQLLGASEPDLFVAMLALFPVNYILCAITLMVDVIRELDRRDIDQIVSGRVVADHRPDDGTTAVEIADDPPTVRARVLSVCNRLLERTQTFPRTAVVLLLPLLAIVVVVIALFGQQPDAALRVFTETSGWTFSQRVSPPPVYVDDHYLCTVAAGGHPALVKPQRWGERHGRRIVVNRQLCVANAFEELIAHRSPRFHRWVRGTYDRCGLPVARLIRAPAAADITYIVMKPLEWFFLAVLYSADRNPETRIARQYLPASVTGTPPKS